MIHQKGAKAYLIFLAKLFGFFVLFYYGTIFWIGLATPGGSYVPFISNYLDYIHAWRVALMKGGSLVTALYGYDVVWESNYTLRVLGGKEVIIAYDCVGYGVVSFWTAFVLAYPNATSRWLWILLGFIAILLINSARIGLYLVARNKGWEMPLGIDQHTWFNIIAYGFILWMMYLFDKKQHIVKE